MTRFLIEQRRANSAMNLAELMLCVAILIIVCFSGATSEGAKSVVKPRPTATASSTSAHRIRIAGGVVTVDGAPQPLQALDALSGEVTVYVASATAGGEVSRVLTHVKTTTISISFEEE